MGENMLDKWWRSAASQEGAACRCLRCIDERDEFNTRFTACPDCGNKRCPKASDHRLACTQSNEPGQLGSRYVATRPSPTPQ